ncbi:MAG: glycoside hydrolase family 2 protein [Fusicatenibacter sp.]|nr:glycoside hydrolase family 2 protein [Lachnospiraceae bacterium]MDY2938224.1 glycoside hydrolase family 2 protein [Fusicatenibacter sp.]
MTTISLKDNWTLTVLGKNVYDIPEEPIETKVPSTVYGTLLEKGLMPDPYFRDNELDATKLMENDFVYETEFSIGEEAKEADRLFLHFEGIDTLADVFLDDILLGSANNMNRAWEYDITSAVKGSAGDAVHHLKVLLHSPTRFIEEENEKCPVGGSSDAMPGFPHIRKAACMYGWDWGPRLPDAGLFREVYIEAVKTARISQVLLCQKHNITGKTIHGNEVSSVEVTADVEIEWMTEKETDKVQALLLLTSPDGNTTVSAASEPIDFISGSSYCAGLTGMKEKFYRNHVSIRVTVEDPMLWWPNGYGAQPLYQAQVLLLPADAKKESCTQQIPTEEPLDLWQKKIGLRTMTVNTDPMPDEVFDPHMTDQMTDFDDGDNMVLSQGDKKVFVTDKEAKKVEGRNFAFEVNGLQIFAMGADYIPEDNILTRQNRERTDLLLASAQESHFNCLRVWGGGYFLDDFFYDVCDERGLLVWQDCMFACASYELNDAFEENISAEIRQNIRRLRSHPSMGLWCGNNEMETQYETLAWPQSKKQYYDYIHLYEYIIPKIVKEEDPMAFYWPSSPSSGGNYENSNAENVGDVHYWGVWHGNEPFTAYRKHHYRFLSEFGFQSFPSLQTVRRFTDDGDRNIYSRVMEMHQRNTAANGKIMNYISQTYLYPKNFDELLYISQLLQADAIRYGVEHFRRFRGTCMGAVVWQLNDIWPVASWASVDYYGNWKALQYAEKRMFAPVLLSCEEHGEIDQKPYVNTLPHPIDISADLHVANETDQTIDGVVRWSLRLPDSSVIREGSFEVKVSPYSGTWLPHLDFNGEDPLKAHLEYALIVDEQVISSGSTLFCAPKHYEFLDPELTVSVEGDTVTVTAKNYAKSVSVETEQGVLRLDDNFVDMEAGTKTFRILPSRDFTDDGTGVSGAYRARSVYETSER